MIALWLALVLAAPSVAAARLPAVLTEHAPAFQVRPATIDYTGDGSAVVGGLNGTGPRHLGRLKMDHVQPARGGGRRAAVDQQLHAGCADGHFGSVRVSVHVFSAHSGHFRRLDLTYTYRGHRYVDRREIHLYRRPGARIWG